jgi:hypothetical protein
MGTSIIPGSQRKTSPTAERRCRSSIGRTLRSLKGTRKRRVAGEGFQGGDLRHHLFHLQFKNVLRLTIPKVLHLLEKKSALPPKAGNLRLRLTSHLINQGDLTQNVVFLTGQFFDNHHGRNQVINSTKTLALFAQFRKFINNTKKVTADALRAGTHDRMT